MLPTALYTWGIFPDGSEGSLSCESTFRTSQPLAAVSALQACVQRHKRPRIAVARALEPCHHRRVSFRRIHAPSTQAHRGRSDAHFNTEAHRSGPESAPASRSATSPVCAASLRPRMRQSQSGRGSRQRNLKRRNSCTDSRIRPLLRPRLRHQSKPALALAVGTCGAGLSRGCGCSIAGRAWS